MPKQKVYHTSKKDEYGTPQDLFDRLNGIYSFDLDVCATPENAKCPIYFTQEQDGLKQDWFGRVWMNPPYSQVGEWLDRMRLARALGDIELGVALVAARTDTQWFQGAIYVATDVVFLKGRLTFEGEKAGAPFPSALLVFTPPGSDERHTYWWDWKKEPPPMDAL